MSEIKSIYQNLHSPSCQNKLLLTGQTVVDITYGLIKRYMIANTPAQCGIRLGQTYNPDPTQSGIFLDVSYNWKADKAGKVPAIYVQRGQMNFKNQTIGTNTKINPITGAQNRIVFVTMPITVTCVSAEPKETVEYLAEYVKQPLLYFRKEIEEDFGIRRFMVNSISPIEYVGTGKNNFAVTINIETVFDEGSIITRESMKYRRIGIELFDQLMQPLETFIV